MTKLTQEQKEQIDDLIQTDTWQSVLAACQIQVEAHESRLLTCDVSKSDRDIVLLKAKLDGARDVQRGLYNIWDMLGITKKRN
jgi:hypothetical protein